MTIVYRNHLSPDHGAHMDYCRAAVHETGRGVSFYQCSRKGKIEEDGMMWCAQHAPSAEKRRRKERDIKYQRDRAAESLKWTKRGAKNKIATIAIRYFKQQATFDKLESALQAYEALGE